MFATITIMHTRAGRYDKSPARQTRFDARLPPAIATVRDNGTAPQQVEFPPCPDFLFAGYQPNAPAQRPKTMHWKTQLSDFSAEAVNSIRQGTRF